MLKRYNMAEHFRRFYEIFLGKNYWGQNLVPGPLGGVKGWGVMG